MELTLQRYQNDSLHTRGLLYIDGIFQCHTLEDAVRHTKIKGITAIPKGRYRIKLQEYVTPLTIKYRKRYGAFFKHHLHLQDVPGFSGIYIHIGNKVQDTNGCILVGDEVRLNKRLGSSTAAFKKLYTILYSEVKDDSCEVWITIK